MSTRIISGYDFGHCRVYYNIKHDVICIGRWNFDSTAVEMTSALGQGYYVLGDPKSWINWNDYICLGDL